MYTHSQRQKPYSLVVLSLLGCAGWAAAAEGPERPAASIGVWNGMLVVNGPASAAGALPGASQRITAEWRDATLGEVAEFLRATCQLNVVCLQGTAEKSLTLAAREMELGNLVRWISRLTDTHATYHEEALVFSETPLRSADAMRFYDVSALTRPLRDFPGPELALAPEGGVSFTRPGAEHAGTDIDELAEFLRRQLRVE